MLIVFSNLRMMRFVSVASTGWAPYVSASPSTPTASSLFWCEAWPRLYKGLADVWWMGCRLFRIEVTPSDRGIVSFLEPA